MSVVVDNELACAVALASLPAMWPTRLATIVGAFGFVDGWRHVATGDPQRRVAPLLARSLAATRRGSDVLPAWHVAAASIDPHERLEAHRAAGISVTTLGALDYPGSIAGDIEPPQVLFRRGDLAALDAPRVAIVGTRRCTRTGAGIAYELGRDLAAAGVAVVSGLALGIDGAAHRGALAAEAAAPIAVVGSGLDIVYPRRHSEVWHLIGERGLLLGEAPLGGLPRPWRFPARNRIIAALADVLVVVESHERGGSLLTVDEADRRGVDVFAVPGSVRVSASAGTNALLAEGRPPARDATDVLVALGLDAASQRGAAAIVAQPDDAVVLDAFEWQAVTLDLLAMRTSLPLSAISLALARLENNGWITASGGWYERVAERCR